MPYRAISGRLRDLGPTLTLGLLILAAGGWGFGALAEEVAEGDTGLDNRIASELHEHATRPLTEFFEAVTTLGNGLVLAGITVLAAYLLARRRYYREAVLMALAFVGSEVLSYSLKLAFRRDRPFFTDPLANLSTYSFPSGHATVSIAVYGALSLVVLRRLQGPARLVCLATALLLVSLIGFSRLYLGVHFFSDVLAGFSIGLAWLALCVVALDLHDKRRTRLYTSR
ncbi:MAG: phosphatase PAP2 family protein [Actinobacteria bacterium]|nr:phosphatase PAP2 family protein [Actinomycetota bacterium]